RRHTRSYGDWSSDVCSSDLGQGAEMDRLALEEGREGPRVGTPDAEDDGAQDAGEAERNHDDGDDRLADHRPQDEPLHGEAEQHQIGRASCGQGWRSVWGPGE